MHDSHCFLTLHSSHILLLFLFALPPIKFLDASLFEHKIFFHKQVTAPAKPQQVVEKAEPMAEATEAAKKVADAAPVVSPPKVDFATDLFDLLSMDGPTENGSEAAANDDNSWAGFQCMFSSVWAIITYHDLLCVIC